MCIILILKIRAIINLKTLNILIFYWIICDTKILLTVIAKYILLYNCFRISVLCNPSKRAGVWKSTLVLWEKQVEGRRRRWLQFLLDERNNVDEQIENKTSKLRLIWTYIYIRDLLTLICPIKGQFWKPHRLTKQLSSISA